MRGRYKFQMPKAGNGDVLFLNKWVRFARADKAAISEAQTPTYYVEVVPSFTHCRWMHTSVIRQECATLIRFVNYSPHKTTDRRHTDVAVVCWLPKFHDF